jgi:hypothetical protein
MRADEVNGYSIIFSGNDLCRSVGHDVFMNQITHNIGVPRTREDEIVVGGLDVAKIPLKVTYSISDFVEKGLLFQYAVYRASSLFSIASYATRKHEIRVGLDKDLRSCHQ